MLPGEVDDIDYDVFDPSKGHTVERTSTPFEQSVGSVSTISSTDPFTQQKISALEDELAALRSQIALMISEQEKSRPSPGTNFSIKLFELKTVILF